jgi:hypothetical protein
VSLELDWRHVAERLVESPVVEPVEEGEGGPPDVLDVAPGTLEVDQLALVKKVL